MSVYYLHIKVQDWYDASQWQELGIFVFGFSALHDQGLTAQGRTDTLDGLVEEGMKKC